MLKNSAGKQKVPLYLLGGFLGSGKTSLLNSILALYEGRNVGVIINEFGDLGIDSSLIPEGSGIKVSELNGGQLFCSCLSGSFVKSITAYKDMDIDLLIVEASGLAKPAPLNEIITFAGKTGGEFFNYKGMIGVVDAERFEILDDTLLTIGEQVAYSDSLLINKIDLVDEDTIERIKKRLLELKADLKIITTTYGKIDRDFLQAVGTPSENSATGTETPDRHAPEERRKWAGWGTAGRPRPIVLVPDNPVSEKTLKTFISAIAGETFRIKGFIDGDNGVLLKADCTGPNVKVEKHEGPRPKDKNGLVILVAGNSDIPERTAEIWKKETGTDAKVDF